MQGVLAAREKTMRIFWAGRLSRDKNVQTLMRAITLCPDCVLFVAGDGPARKPLEKLSERLGICQRVFFLGKLNEQQMDEQYEQCDVYCQPSLFADASPRTVMEAMSHAKPCIISDRAGYDDAPVVRLPALDYKAWAAALSPHSVPSEEATQKVLESLKKPLVHEIKDVFFGTEKSQWL